MFPPTSDLDRPTTRSAWARIRNAADLVIAFVTLDSYGIDDLPHGRLSNTDLAVGALAIGSAGASADGRAGASTTGPPAGPCAIAARPSTDPASRTRTGPGPGTELPADVRPHREKLRARSRPRRPGTLEPAEQPSRRPGTLEPAEQPCLTPLAPLAERTAAAGPEPQAWRCRTEAPDPRDS